MALKDRLENPPKPQHGYPCSVGALLTQLKGTELAALKTMLGSPEKRGWPASEIYSALTDEGYTVGLQTINRHRGGLVPVRTMSGESHVEHVTREGCAERIEAILTEWPMLRGFKPSPDCCSCCGDMDVADEYGWPAANAWSEIQTWIWLMGDES